MVLFIKSIDRLGRNYTDLVEREEKRGKTTRRMRSANVGKRVNKKE